MDDIEFYGEEMITIRQVSESYSNAGDKGVIEFKLYLLIYDSNFIPHYCESVNEKRDSRNTLSQKPHEFVWDYNEKKGV